MTPSFIIIFLRLVLITVSLVTAKPLLYQSGGLIIEINNLSWEGGELATFQKIRTLFSLVPSLKLFDCITTLMSSAPMAGAGEGWVERST